MRELSAPVACQYSMCTGQSFFSAACVQHRNCCYTSMLNHAGRLSLVQPPMTWKSSRLRDERAESGNARKRLLLDLDQHSKHQRLLRQCKAYTSSLIYLSPVQAISLNQKSNANLFNIELPISTRPSSRPHSIIHAHRPV